MATPPPDTTFKKTDYPSTGLGSNDALDKFFLQLNAFTQSTRAGLNKGLGFGQNFNGEIKVIQVTTPATDWTTVAAASLAGGWTLYDPSAHPVRYRKSSAGYVTLEGLVVSAATGTAFTLPAGYRPEFDNIRATTINTGGTITAQRVNATAGGDVQLFGANPSTWGVLDMSYYCADQSAGVLSCFPVTIKSKVTSPACIVVGGVYDGGNSPPVTSIAGVDWKSNSNGTLSINNIPGLALGRKYTITLLIIGG